VLQTACRSSEFAGIPTCFPLSGRKVICADQSSYGFFVDADACVAGTLRPFKRPKRMPFSISIPRPDIDDDHLFKTGAMIGSIFFVMERFPQHGDRFEVFVNSAEYLCDKGKEWYSKLLPPPPFVRKTPSQSRNRAEITAYAVVGGGSHICVSVEGAAAGTYWMDTASYEWTKIGEWTLPFYGKVEYVPEPGFILPVRKKNRRSVRNVFIGFLGNFSDSSFSFRIKI
jgi:hypothetical protein